MTACGSDTSSSSAAPTPVTETVTSTRPAAPDPSTEDSSGGTTATITTTGGDGERCSARDLTGRVRETPNNAAGTTSVELVFINTSGRTCTLHGFPGVSFVGDGNGTQIGAPARRTSGDNDQTITLRANERGTSTVQIAQARNYPDATCRPHQVDGFRVYPPNDTASLFIRYSSATGCESSDVSLLKVTALNG
ncbi:Protein of unknown function [Williamsia sterculiae]|uniref:DUF4232 domain-containing protein n=2 Tax=Williamsia sterculiae TaxID=1344003 RepID=A0A1N7G7X6_9NOCA|nr:Protein of unknown function [Williamsia sterculiae]